MGGSLEQVILLAEDEDSDALFVRHAFQKAKIQNAIQVVKNGADLICYLKGEGRYSDRAKFPLPIFVLLDLDMPEVSGFEVLSWMRSQENFKSLPVLVVTGSTKFEDELKSKELGALGFFRKSLRLEDLPQMVRAVGGSWLLQTGQ